jgi:hypothetical protein
MFLINDIFVIYNFINGSSGSSAQPQALACRRALFIGSFELTSLPGGGVWLQKLPHLASRTAARRASSSIS